MKNSMHLFAGAGGGLISDLILGHTPICAVEWEPYACKILRERAEEGWFPDLRVYEGDVRLFDPSEYAGRIHTICSGFPCQDLSIAGKQAGLGEGTRSGLYREVLRIADVVRPRELFMENVAAILSNGLGTVLGDLASRGYSARWICLRASDVGANHHRDRWWLLARRGDVRHPKHDGQLASKVAGSITQGGDHNASGQEQTEQFARPGEQHADVADTNSTRLQRINGSTERRESSEAQRQLGQCCGNEQRQTQPSLGLLATKFPADLVQGWWEVEPDIGRVTDVSKDRAAQLKALGNAQVPLQAATAYSILAKLMEQEQCQN